MDKDLKLNLSFTLFLQSCATDQCHPVQLGPWAQKWPPYGEQLCCWRCDPVWVQSRLYAGGTECHRMFDSSQCPGTMEQLHTQLYRWGVTTHTDNTDKNAYTLTSFIHLFVTLLNCFIQFTHSLFSSVPASVFRVSWCELMWIFKLSLLWHRCRPPAIACGDTVRTSRVAHRSQAVPRYAHRYTHTCSHGNIFLTHKHATCSCSRCSSAPQQMCKCTEQPGGRRCLKTVNYYYYNTVQVEDTVPSEDNFTWFFSLHFFPMHYVFGVVRPSRSRERDI